VCLNRLFGLGRIEDFAGLGAQGGGGERFFEDERSGLENAVMDDGRVAQP